MGTRLAFLSDQAYYLFLKREKDILYFFYNFKELLSSIAKLFLFYRLYYRGFCDRRIEMKTGKKRSRIYFEFFLIIIVIESVVALKVRKDEEIFSINLVSSLSLDGIPCN